MLAHTMLQNCFRYYFTTKCFRSFHFFASQEPVKSQSILWNVQGLSMLSLNSHFIAETPKLKCCIIVAFFTKQSIPIREGVLKEKALFQPQKINKYVFVFSVKMFNAAYVIFFWVLLCIWLFNFLLVQISPAKSASNELKMILKFSYSWNGAQCKGGVKIKNEVTMLFSANTSKNAAKIIIKTFLVLFTVKPTSLMAPRQNTSFAECQGSWLYAIFILKILYWKSICAFGLSGAGN